MAVVYADCLHNMYETLITFFVFEAFGFLHLFHKDFICWIKSNSKFFLKQTFPESIAFGMCEVLRDHFYKNWMLPCHYLYSLLLRSLYDD